MGESELHRELKRAACRWLWGQGYASIAEGVRVPGLGIIDVAAAGKIRKRNPRDVRYDRPPSVDRKHVVFIECKAHRADFIADHGRQKQFEFALAERAERLRGGRARRPRCASPALGKFDSCLLRPHAHYHLLLTPPGLLTRAEAPRRWGWLVWEWGVIRVVRRPTWHEVAEVGAIEGAIARALTAQRMFTWVRGGGRVEPIEGESEPPTRALGR